MSGPVALVGKPWRDLESAAAVDDDGSRLGLAAGPCRTTYDLSALDAAGSDVSSAHQPPL